jgi:hypothetical protein
LRSLIAAVIVFEIIEADLILVELGLASPATRWMSVGAASSKTLVGTVAAPATPCMPRVGPCTPALTLLTEKHRQRLESLFAGDEHVEIEAT